MRTWKMTEKIKEVKVLLAKQKTGGGEAEWVGEGSKTAFNNSHIDQKSYCAL